jgi:hypothetical protein
MTSLTKKWRLMRLDDNGNEFEVERYHDRAAADKACVEFERRGHKQTYYVTKKPEGLKK